MARDRVVVGKRKSPSKKVKVRRKSEDKPAQHSHFEKRTNTDKPRAFHAQVDRIADILAGK